MHNFLAALAFLSSLPLHTSQKTKFSSMLSWFGLAGSLIAAFAFLPVLLLFLFTSPQGQMTPFIASLIWLAAEAWLTGGLHWDGLADLADALGSGARGDKFWQILNDSRLGSYGGLALVFFILFAWLAAASLFMGMSGKDACMAKLVFLLMLSGCWSRLCPLWLAYKTEAWSGSRLAALFCGQVSSSVFALGIVQALICLGILHFLKVPVRNICALAIGQLFLIRYLVAKAKKAGGMSGDFMGAGIVASEVLFIFCAQP